MSSPLLAAPAARGLHPAEHPAKAISPPGRHLHPWSFGQPCLHRPWSKQPGGMKSA